MLDRREEFSCNVGGCGNCIGLSELSVKVEGLSGRLDEIRDLIVDMRSRYDGVIFGNGGSGLSGRVVSLEERFGIWRWVVPVLLGYLLFLTGVVLKLLVG